MRRILISVAALFMLTACAEPAQHPTDLSSKEVKTMMRAAKKSKEKYETCQATVNDSYSHPKPLHCSDGVCKTENPNGTVRNFECKNSVCPVVTGKEYARSCKDGLNILNGCVVTYKDVTQCK